MIMIKKMKLLAVLLITSSQAHSDNLDGDLDSFIGMPPELVENVGPESIHVLQGVSYQYKIWDVGTTLNFCFMDGRVQQHAFFESSASEWLEYADGLSFNFKNPSGQYLNCGSDYAQIRVSFSSPGNWSYIGTDALRADAANPTLNISRMQIGSARSKSTILHEVGHALSMAHEHQSPRAACGDQIDWQSALSYFAGSPNHWSEEKTRRNLEPIVNQNRVRLTEYDPQSIMHYVFPREIFSRQLFDNGERPSCFLARKNVSISEADGLLISTMYPTTPAMQDEYIAALERTTAELLTEKGLSPEDIEEAGQFLRSLLPELSRDAALSSVSYSAIMDNPISGRDMFNNIQINQSVVGNGNVQTGISTGQEN
jgi:hypothetical protein